MSLRDDLNNTKLNLNAYDGDCFGFSINGEVFGVASIISVSDKCIAFTKAKFSNKKKSEVFSEHPILKNGDLISIQKYGTVFLESPAENVTDFVNIICENCTTIPNLKMSSSTMKMFLYVIEFKIAE